MSINDVFRHFFGYPSHSFPDERQQGNDYDNDQPHFDNPYHSHFADEVDDMFRHFEQHFQEVFRNFGFMEFSPPSLPDGSSEREMLPSLPPASDVPLRDRLLKRPGHGYNGLEVPETEPHFSQPTKPWFRGWFEREKPDGDNSLKDQDLDSAVSKGGLDLILEPSPDRTSERAARLPTHSFFSSSSVTIRGSDGKVEERHTKIDSFGNEETSVKRQYGDQAHSVITRKGLDGRQEQAEHFTNMDETNVAEFEKKWNSGDVNSPNLNNPHPPIGQQEPVTSSGILSRLFRSFF